MLWVVSLIVAIAANVAMAQRRRRRVWPWVIGAVLIGLISTIILAILSPLNMRTCPACKSAIPGDASRCRYCQADVTPA